MLDHPSNAECRTTRSPSAEKASAPGPFSYLNVWGPAAGKIGAWNKNGQQIGEAIVQDWLQFVSERMVKDFAFAAQLAACKTPNDVYLVYSQFWQQAAKDYAAEFTSITDLVWQAVRSPFAISTSGQRKWL
jgi:hypothetical protein